MNSLPPLVKTVQTVQKSFLCPTCGKPFGTMELYEVHFQTCPGKGLEFGAAYLGKRMLKEDKDGNLLIFIVNGSQAAMVKGRMAQINPHTATMNLTEMTMTVEDLREWHMVTDEEAAQAMKDALTAASKTMVDAIRGSRS